jgi:L-amino acid N-acyltransferase YncA
MEYGNHVSIDHFKVSLKHTQCGIYVIVGPGYERKGYQWTGTDSILLQAATRQKF